MSKLINHVKFNNYYKYGRTFENSIINLYNLVINNKSTRFIDYLNKLYPYSDIIKSMQNIIKWIDKECTPYDLELLTKSEFIKRINSDIKLDDLSIKIISYLWDYSIMEE